MLVAAAAAAVAFGAWRVWREDPAGKVYRRTIADLMLTYRCERGHRFAAQGQVEPMTCISCGKDAYPVTDYYCPTHGRIDVLVRFSKTGEDLPDIVAVSLDGDRWISAEVGLRCPKCGQAIHRDHENSIARLGEPADPDGETLRRPATPTRDQPRPNATFPEDDFQTP